MDGEKPLRMIMKDGRLIEFLENVMRNDSSSLVAISLISHKSSSSIEGALDSQKEAHSGWSFEKFAAFSKFSRKLINVSEKEISALLIKVETRQKMKASICIKGHKAIIYHVEKGS